MRLSRQEWNFQFHSFYFYDIIGTELWQTVTILCRKVRHFLESYISQDEILDDIKETLREYEWNRHLFPYMQVTDNSRYFTHENSQEAIEEALSEAAECIKRAIGNCYRNETLTTTAYIWNIQTEFGKAAHKLTMEEIDVHIDLVDQYGNPWVGRMEVDWKYLRETVEYLIEERKYLDMIRAYFEAKYPNLNPSRAMKPNAPSQEEAEAFLKLVNPNFVGPLTSEQQDLYNFVHKDDPCPRKLKDGTPITRENSENQETYDFFMKYIYKKGFGYDSHTAYTAYAAWLRDTYGEKVVPWNTVLDIVQTVIDIVGLIPVVGEIADGVNAVIYLIRGDKLNAALSAGSMIPIAGWLTTGGKFIKNAFRYGDEVIDGVAIIARNADEAGALIKGVVKHGDEALEGGEQLVKHGDELLKGAGNWTNGIKGTQEVISGTNVPKSFVMKGKVVNGNEVWVHGNATKHMGEYINSAKGSVLVENELMSGFNTAVDQVLPQVQPGKNFFSNINGWEIGINGDTGVIYHALYK